MSKLVVIKVWHRIRKNYRQLDDLMSYQAWLAARLELGGTFQVYRSCRQALLQTIEDEA
jgi:hypothetical protein